MYCKSAQEWVDVMKSHVCRRKNLVLADRPLDRMIGSGCRGCGQEFNVDVKVVKETLKDVQDDVDIQIRTKEGRKQIVASCNK